MTIRDNYIQYRTDPDNDDKSLSHFCTMYGVSLDEARAMLDGDNLIHQDILTARRTKYADRMRKIDDALFKSAEAGDTRAADLLYRRFDNWNPKIVEETNNFYNFAEIAKKVAKETPPKRTVRFKRIAHDGET